MSFVLCLQGLLSSVVRAVLWLFVGLTGRSWIFKDKLLWFESHMCCVHQLPANAHWMQQYRLLCVYLLLRNAAPFTLLLQLLLLLYVVMQVCMSALQPR
jgi:hypothetical protein